MAVFVKNPDVPDYFSVIEGLSLDTPLDEIPSFVPEYEDGRLLYFPDLKLDIDVDFWAGLPADQLPALKKLVCHVDPDNQAALIDRALRKGDAPEALRDGLHAHMARLFAQVMPIYDRIFAGYDFSVRRAVWRLNTTIAENLHFDTYGTEQPGHFARMFINLDSQPRIWHTGLSVQDLAERSGRNLADEDVRTASANELFRRLRIAAFGPGFKPFHTDPCHIVYFEPGDVWVVDSRQVSHQIFYGRRAISIDFVVEVESMADPTRHYLRIAEAFRSRLLSRTADPVA